MKVGSEKQQFGAGYNVLPVWEGADRREGRDALYPARGKQVEMAAIREEIWRALQRAGGGATI